MIINNENRHLYMSTDEVAEFLGLNRCSVLEYSKPGKPLQNAIMHQEDRNRKYFPKSDVNSFKQLRDSALPVESLLSIRQLCKLLKVNNKRISDLMDKGVIKPVYTIRTGHYFTRDVLETIKNALLQIKIEKVKTINNSIIREKSQAIDEVFRRSMEIPFPKTNSLFKEYVQTKIYDTESKNFMIPISQFTVLSRNLATINEEFYKQSNTEIKGLICSLKTTPGIQLGYFANYCRVKMKDECLYTTIFAREAEVDKKAKQPKLSKKHFIKTWEFVSNLSYHLPRAISDSKYCQQWIYVAVHFFDAKRAQDIVELPEIKLETIGILTFDFFNNQSLTEKQSQIIVNQYHKWYNFSANKTKAHLKFVVPDKIIQLFAHALVIAELHRRIFNEEKLLFHYVKWMPSTKTLNSIFFKGHKELHGFSNYKATRSFLSDLREWLEKQGKEHLVYDLPSNLRGHTKGKYGLSNTTRIYIDSTNEDGKFEEVCKELVHRDVFGWVDVYFLRLIKREKYDELTSEEQNRAIEELRQNLSPIQIEGFAKFLMDQLFKGKTFIEEVKAMPEEELSARISKVSLGLSPAMDDTAQCFIPEKCSKKHLGPDACIPCHRVLGNRYFLISLNRDLQKLINKLEKFPQDSPDYEKALTHYAGDMILLRQAIQTYGEGIVDAFIDRKSIRAKLDSIAERTSQLSIQRGD